MPRIIRLFPTKTNATPDDDLAAVDRLPTFFDNADEVHISCLFTWDKPKAERLAKEWEHVAHIKFGGPAYGSRGEDFIPGEYVRPGYVITSRGCPNKCWFCSVWKREGSDIRELPIHPGFNVLDDNLLACSEKHVRAVFDMLKKEKEPIQFTGGWEAARLHDWHVELLASVRLGQVWFAYDEDADLEPLIRAGEMLSRAGLNFTKTGNVSHKVRCYVLVGGPKDTIDAADLRLRTAYKHGFLPMAMLFRNEKGETSRAWRKFQKYWARPASINSMCRKGERVDLTSY